MDSNDNTLSNNPLFEGTSYCEGPYRHTLTIDGIKGSAYQITLPDGSHAEGIIMNMKPYEWYNEGFPGEVGYVKTNCKNPHSGKPLYKLYLQKHFDTQLVKEVRKE